MYRLVSMGIMTNVLFVERVSDDRGDRTDSFERQDEKLHRRAAERRATGEVINVVAVVRDRSVSGDVDPMDRPDLGQWLAEEGRDKWDEIWVTTQDRLHRNDMHFMSLVFRMLVWGKVLVLLDDPSLDLTTVEGRAIAHVKAIGPHKELERIKARAKDSANARRYTAAWVGGIPPYGYTTKWGMVEFGGELKRRRVLVLDQYMASVLHEMRQWLLEGETLTGVADRLNARGELTRADLWRTRQDPPREIKGERWHGHGIREHLESMALLGYKMVRKGKDRFKTVPLQSKDGSLFRIAEPVFTDQEWRTLQSALASRRKNTGGKKVKSPLIGVVFCGKCGRHAYQVTNRVKDTVYRYIRCNQAKACPRIGMRAEEVEALVEQTFLEAEADSEIMTREWNAGSDVEQEKEEVELRIGRLRADREQGLFDEPDDQEYFNTKMKEYRDRKRELDAAPRLPSGWVYSGTGVTFGQAWPKLNSDERRDLLVQRGVTFTIHDLGQWSTYIPKDWPDKVS